MPPFKVPTKIPINTLFLSFPTAMRTCFFLALVFFFATGCKVIKNQAENLDALSRCSFDLVNVEKRVSFTEKTNNLWNYVITLNFEGNNPNERDVFIGEYDLDLYVNDRLLSKITNTNPLILKANGTTSFSLKTIVSPSGAFSLFWKKLRNKRIEYRVSGTFYLKLGVVRLPFTINLLRMVDNPDE